MLRWYQFVCTKFTQTDKKWYVFILSFHAPCSWPSRTLIHWKRAFISITFGIYWQNIYLLHPMLLNLHVARVMMCWVHGCWFSTRGWSWLVLVVHDVVGSGVEDLLLVVGEVRRSVRSEQDLSLVHSCQKQINNEYCADTSPKVTSLPKPKMSVASLHNVLLTKFPLMNRTLFFSPQELFETQNETMEVSLWPPT